jgi:hypothetical protein
LLATVIRTGLVVISYGCKVPAGIFVPSMAIGATFGRMLGILVKALYQCVFRQLRRRTAVFRLPLQGIPNIWDFQILHPRCTVYHPWHIRLLGRRRRFEVCSHFMSVAFC